MPVSLLEADLLPCQSVQVPKVTDDEIQQMVKEHKFFAAYKCSAKSGENIKKACRHLVTQIVKNNETERRKAEEKEMEEGAGDDRAPIQLTGNDGGAEKSGGCC